MERHGDDVGDEDEGDSHRPRGNGAPEDEVAKPEPVAGNEGNFEGPYPGGHAACLAWMGDEVVDGEDVQVEAGDTHDGVVGVFLIGDNEVGEGVPHECKVVVGGVDGLEE